MILLHLIGSASVLFVICYIIVDLLEKKQLTVEDIISRLALVSILFIILLRT